MLGHVLFRGLWKHSLYDVCATARSSDSLELFTPTLRTKIQVGVDAERFDTIVHALATIQPDTVINCIGLSRQPQDSQDPAREIMINALFPHRLSLACRTARTRLIHISTDGVFDGKRGSYVEGDEPSAIDLYGRTKYFGEVHDAHCVTLRTSMIGHELKGKRGLIEWFLSQSHSVKGFTKAVFSGLPTIELAHIVSDFILPNQRISGLFHVSAQPITKFDLLGLIAKQYGVQTRIEPAGEVSINRFLVSKLFQEATGYLPPSWPELVSAMHHDFCHEMKKFNICSRTI